jgi:hypothetical protein
MGRLLATTAQLYCLHPARCLHEPVPLSRSGKATRSSWGGLICGRQCVILVVKRYSRYIFSRNWRYHTCRQEVSYLVPSGIIHPNSRSQLERGKKDALNANQCYCGLFLFRFFVPDPPPSHTFPSRRFFRALIGCGSLGGLYRSVRVMIPLVGRYDTC